jgi:hypothetical protein
MGPPPVGVQSLLAVAHQQLQPRVHLPLPPEVRFRHAEAHAFPFELRAELRVLGTETLDLSFEAFGALAGVAELTRRVP